MQQRQLGHDGPLVPVIGFGAWPIGGGMGLIDERQAINTMPGTIRLGTLEQVHYAQEPRARLGQR